MTGTAVTDDRQCRLTVMEVEYRDEDFVGAPPPTPRDGDDERPARRWTALQVGPLTTGQGEALVAAYADPSSALHSSLPINAVVELEGAGEERFLHVLSLTADPDDLPAACAAALSISVEEQGLLTEWWSDTERYVFVDEYCVEEAYWKAGRVVLTGVNGHVELNRTGYPATALFRDFRGTEG